MDFESIALKKLLKLCGDEEKDIPVIHMPFYANTFPLVCGYRTELKKLNGNKKTALISKKIRIEEWGNKMPRLDTNARYNIFFASQNQIERWKERESFYYAHIFEYKHKFVLVEKAKYTISPLSLSRLCDRLIGSKQCEEIRIVSDIIPEAEKLRKEVISLINMTFHPDTFEIRKISVVDSKKRSLTDVFEESDKIFKIYLFGTPLCEILKNAKKRYETVGYNSDTENTYLCVFSPTPETAFLPFIFIYEFFQENNYDNNVELDDVAKKFLKQAESSFPAIEEPKFIEAFNLSINEHCKLMPKRDFQIDYK